MRLPDNVTGIIFDCDGTLVDSEAIHATALSAVLGNGGHRISADVIMQRFTGCDIGRLLRQLSDEWRVTWPPGIEALIEDATRELLDEQATAMSGAVAALNAVREHNMCMAVASNSSHRLVAAMLRRTRLAEYFGDRVATRDQVGAPKPAPDVYRLAARLCATAPSSLLAIDDSPAGILSARAAGMTAIGYLPPQSTIAVGDLERAGAFVVLDHLNQLADLVHASRVTSNRLDTVAPA